MNEGEKKTGRSKKVYTVAALVIAAAFLIGIGIYNTPSNRLHRQLELGDKYLAEERYEEACIAYEQAIAIDERCMEAYIGGMEAYQCMGQEESLRMLYDRALEAAGELDADAIDENMDYLVRIYLMTQEVYGDNPEWALACLIDGYRLTARNEQIKEQLINIYMAWADKLAQEEAFEKAVSILNEGYEETHDGRLKQKLKEIEERYQQYLEWQAYMELVDDILTRIAAFCQKEDYDAAFTLMQSEEYGKFLDRIDEIEEMVGLQTAYGSIGLYKVDSETFGNYMIYYGSYEGSVRQGEGVWMGYFEGNNYIAKGNWTQDMPQGEFTVREWSGILDESVVYRVITGNVNQGLWDGDVVWAFEETDGNTSSYPVSFHNGRWVVLYYDEDGEAVVCEKGSGGGKLVAGKTNENKDLGIVGIAPDY